eukprot:m.193999 g.193999  ORF g.193999 m.193999 type:complete len:207 (-) comp15671_c0_seq3:1270-1890(-)
MQAIKSEGACLAVQAKIRGTRETKCGKCGPDQTSHVNGSHVHEEGARTTTPDVASKEDYTHYEETINENLKEIEEKDKTIEDLKMKLTDEIEKSKSTKSRETNLQKQLSTVRAELKSHKRSADQATKEIQNLKRQLEDESPAQPVSNQRLEREIDRARNEAAEWREKYEVVETKLGILARSHAALRKQVPRSSRTQGQRSFSLFNS